MIKNLSRRQFLKIVSAGTCGAALHQVFAPAGQMMAFAQAQATNRVFILVNLSGGASLSLFPLNPDYNPSWFQKMGGATGLGYLPAQAPALNGQVMLNPGLAVLKEIYDEGRMAIINKVGFTNFTRSHAEDTDTWFRGGNTSGQGGWAPLLTNQMASIFAGVSFGGSNLLIQGDGNTPRSFGSLDNFGENNVGWQTRQLRNLRNNLQVLTPNLGTGNSVLVKGAMDNLAASIATVQAATRKALPNPLDYANPSGFVRACQDTAKLLNSPELGTQFVYLERGGWDTHSGARAGVAGNATDVARGLSALIKTLKAINRWQDVTICTMSEFGRTFYNGSGDDHGHSATLMLLGGALAGRVVNAPPSVAEVDAANGFLRGYDVVFWAIFKEIVEWMGYDAAKIFLTPPPNNTITRVGLYA